MMNRLFISLVIPDFIKVQIFEIINTIDTTGLKVENYAKFHITLKFLGNVEKELIPNILSVLNNISSKICSFNIEILKFKLIERNFVPSLIILEVSRNSHLLNLHNAINEELINLGFEREKRRFNPHITILRIKPQHSLEKINKLLNLQNKILEFKADSISLVKSELTQTEALYTSLNTIELRGKDE